MPQTCAKTNRYKVIYINGKRIFLHRYLYEKWYGKIPDGHEIHHRNGNPHDNTKGNIMSCTRQMHMRFERGWRYLGNDEWEKKCAMCGQMFPANPKHFYYRKTHHEKGLYGPYCIPCALRYARQYRERRINAKAS